MDIVEAAYRGVRATGRMTEEDHSVIGRMLGYTDEAIEAFLVNSRRLDAELASSPENSA